MKRALLIAGGTVGGLGAVLAITPPQLGANDALSISAASAGASSGTAEVAPASSSSNSVAATSSSSPKKSGSTAIATNSSEPAAPKKATTGATAAASNSPTSNSTASSSASDATTQTSTPTPAKTTVAPTPITKSGTFTGPAVFVNYGTVQVKITVVNGRITDAVAVQAPSGRNDRWTKMAVPILKQQTLAAQSANIQGASGASYTSYGWYTSLQGALAQAGL